MKKLPMGRKMRKNRIISAFLTVTLMLGYLFSVRTFAADSVAYKKLSEQEPIFISSVTLDSLGKFYEDKNTEEILDNKQNNYINDIVSVGGKPVMCHVYMRTFDISDISSVDRKTAEERSGKFLSEVKDAICTKYLKCIVRSYSITVSVKKHSEKDIYTKMTVQIMLALGESNEQRQSIVKDIVMPTADLWTEMTDAGKLSSLNTFMLDGRFKYDITLNNKSSIYEFIATQKGVCEEYAGLTALFLDYMGYENIIITGKAAGVSHMWNMVKVNDRIYHLDILWNGPIDSKGTHVSIEETYLLKSTESVKHTHTPDSFYSEYTDEAIYDFYLGEIPEGIESELYEVTNDHMLKIPILTTVEMFKQSVSYPEFITVKNGENVLSDTDNVGSGCVIELSVNGQLIQSLNACVIGDIDGDGKTTENDIFTVEDFVLGKRLQTRDYNMMKSLCDINEDGLITVADLFIFVNLMKKTSPPISPEDPETGTGTSDTTASPEETEPLEDVTDSGTSSDMGTEAA